MNKNGLHPEEATKAGQGWRLGSEKQQGADGGGRREVIGKKRQIKCQRHVTTKNAHGCEGGHRATAAHESPVLDSGRQNTGGLSVRTPTDENLASPT